MRNMSCIIGFRDVYPMYAKDMKERRDEPLKQETFTKVWRENFSKRAHQDRGKMWVKMTKVEAGKCKECTEAVAKMRTGEMAQKLDVRKRYREHLLYVSKEREAYAKNMEMAQRGEAISIGADATATYATVSRVKFKISRFLLTMNSSRCKHNFLNKAATRL
jgi:hypothetical protein